ncbi:CCE_0567 family metalloprotein [Martelella endophytica]|uniref:Rop-like protein n=1 Tax=Martelella endophytica TaxID=1486262 RepID=A0A0D5LTS4_MAREN|nr:CCE_0567 family metalloprotein [Martelella endophytica]AJY46778.1 hypothetical protein TM49_15650 [Martelella endophytica]
MNDDNQDLLRRAVLKAKRIAGEKAMELHDLVEDRLPAAYEDLPALAEETYAACRSWAEAEAALAAVSREA